MRHGTSTVLIAIAALTGAAACATSPVMTASAPVPVTNTAGGEVALNSAGGFWIDSVGGIWMDTTGGVFLGGRSGLPLGLQMSDIRAMDDANIIAHVQIGDSLEVILSHDGDDRARSHDVEEFAEEMVRAHTANSVVAGQTAAKAELAPVAAPSDTADGSLAGRIMAHLANVPAGSSYDQAFMRAEVMMHRHMLHELELMHPQSSGPAHAVLDATIPAVRRHLAKAETLWRQVGGGTQP